MIFVGDGADKGEIEKYTEKLGLSDRVHFAGAIGDREKVRAFFSRADLFLFPSTYDTSGLVVKEAAACSCPSVMVRGSCASEEAEDGFTGYLCEENAADCARVITEAVADRAALQKIGENAAEFLYLSWDDSVKKACDRYEVVIEEFKNKKKEVLMNE